MENDKKVTIGTSEFINMFTRSNKECGLTHFEIQDLVYSPIFMILVSIENFLFLQIWPINFLINHNFRQII
jgi:hypothetical protein